VRAPERRVTAEPKAKTESSVPALTSDVADRLRGASPRQEGHTIRGVTRQRDDESVSGCAERACGKSLRDSKKSSHAQHHGSRNAADPALVPQKARALRAWHEQSTVDCARATFEARCIARQRGLRAGRCAGFVGGKTASLFSCQRFRRTSCGGGREGRRGTSRSRSRQ
jgi:hypothetical protein